MYNKVNLPTAENFSKHFIHMLWYVLFLILFTSAVKNIIIYLYCNCLCHRKIIALFLQRVVLGTLFPGLGFWYLKICTKVTKKMQKYHENLKTMKYQKSFKFILFYLQNISAFTKLGKLKNIYIYTIILFCA